MRIVIAANALVTFLTPALVLVSACAGAPVETVDDPGRTDQAAVLDAAVNSHVLAGRTALDQHDLASAQAAFDRAAGLRMDDPRVVAGQSEVAETRNHGARATHESRTRLTALLGSPPVLKDRQQWHALIEDLEWLALWRRDFPEETALRRDAKEAVASFLLLEAQEALAAGDLQRAYTRAEAALAWSPGHPDAGPVRGALQARREFEEKLSFAQAELAASHAESALEAFDLLMGTAEPPQVVRSGRDAAARQVVDALMVTTQQRLADKACAVGKDCVAAMQLIARARSLGTTDPEQLARIDRLFAEAHAPLLAPLRKALQAAVKRKLPAAAVVYAAMIRSIAHEDKEAMAIHRKWHSGVLAQAATTVHLIPAGSLAVPAVKGMRGRADPASTAALPGLWSALVTGVKRGMATAGLDHAALLWQSGAGDKRGKAATTPGPQLVLDVHGDQLERSDTAEPRTKKFLDHVEIVDNPAWEEAQDRQASALLSLNLALNELRPIQEGMNVADRELYAIEQQLAALQEKITQEDKVFYANSPSPCPDGGVACEGTRAKVRWRANTDYFAKQLMRQRELLTQLGPKSVQLQGVVDAKQKQYDQAQKVALETPKRVAKEIWLPHTYEVRKVVYAAQAELSAKLLLPAQMPAAKGKRKVAGVTVGLATTPTWKDRGEDFVTSPVLVKDQVLEPHHASALPDDAALVTVAASKMLEPVLPKLVAALGPHGLRFVDAAAAKSGGAEKLEQLALAWLTAAGLPEETRSRVKSQLAALSGWQPLPGHLDQGTFAYDRLPLAK